MSRVKASRNLTKPSVCRASLVGVASSSPAGRVFASCNNRPGQSGCAATHA